MFSIRDSHNVRAKSDGARKKGKAEWRPDPRLTTIEEDTFSQTAPKRVPPMPNSVQVAGANHFARQIAHSKKQDESFRFRLTSALDGLTHEQQQEFAKIVDETNFSPRGILALVDEMKNESTSAH